MARVVGVALSIAAGGLFACYALSVRKFMVGVNSILAFAAISQYTALAMVGLMLGLGVAYGLPALPAAWIGADAGWLPDDALTVTGFWLLLASSVIGIALGHVAYYMAINRLGVAVASGVIQLQPFVVSIASLVIFKELLTGGQWVAGAVAVAGAGSMLWSQHRAMTGKPPLLARWRPSRGAFSEPHALPTDHVAAASLADTHNEPARPADDASR
jgi:drug/metabolite transporter (DMT)-like permease